jgi:hypothetical protein
MNSILVFDKPNVLNRSLAQVGLLHLNSYLVLTEQIQFNLHMLQMFFPRFAINKNTIQVDYIELTKMRSESFIGGSLKSNRCIDKPKWHHQPLAKVELGLESSFSGVIRFNSYVMIVRSEVNVRDQQSWEVNNDSQLLILFSCSLCIISFHLVFLLGTITAREPDSEVLGQILSASIFLYLPYDFIRLGNCSCVRRLIL